MDLASILQCPRCSASVEEDNQQIRCGSCPWHHSATGKIMHMLPATPEKSLSNQGSRRFWNLRARVYELLLPITRWYGSDEFSYEGAVQQIIARLHPAPDDRVLDVATGTGLVLREICRQPAPPVELVGTDSAEEMLLRAGDWPVTPGAEEPLLVHGDAEHLPFQDNTFTIITCVGALSNFNQPHRALQEMARVLQPGGRVGLLVAVRGTRSRTRLVEWLLRQSYKVMQAPLHWFSPTALAELLRDNGFDDVVVEVLADCWALVICRRAIPTDGSVPT